MRYLADSQTLAPLAKIRNAILSRNRATWANTDTRLDTNEFFKRHTDRLIATHEMGRNNALKDFREYLEMLSEGVAAKNIQDLPSLMSMDPISHKEGTTGGRI